VTDTSAHRVADADRLVAGIAPGVGNSPGVETRDAVLVTGPWLAGTTSLVAVLRERLPEHAFVETGDLAVTEAAKAVVFVAAAVAPLGDSDCALLDLATANTELVIGVVSKTDAHRDWRDVLAADRAALGAHAARYRDVPWVGAAAAPEEGEPDVDELVELLRQRLSDDELARRNRLRAWETRLKAAVQRCEEEADGTGRDARMAALREQRSAALQQGQLAESERSEGLRNQLQQAQVQLANFADNRCTSVHGELQEDVASMTRRRRRGFEDYVRTRARDVIKEVNAGITTQLRDVAKVFGLTPPRESPDEPLAPEVALPPLQSKKLRTAVLLTLGVAIGVGLAFGLSRLFPDAAPAYLAAGLAAGGVVGLAVAAWLASMLERRRDRAVLKPWVSEVTDELRKIVEQLVATRVPAAAPGLAADLAQVEEAEAAKLAENVAAIDLELRDHNLAAARAAARRTRDLPGLQAALHAVRSELGTVDDAGPDGRPASEQEHEHSG
jgi:hypothetical protein